MKAFPSDKSQPWPGRKLMRLKTSEKNGTSMKEKESPQNIKYEREPISFTTILSCALNFPYERWRGERKGFFIPNLDFPDFHFLSAIKILSQWNWWICTTTFFLPPNLVWLFRFVFEEIFLLSQMWAGEPDGPWHRLHPGRHSPRFASDRNQCVPFYPFYS